MQYGFGEVEKNMYYYVWKWSLRSFIDIKGVLGVSFFLKISLFKKNMSDHTELNLNLVRC